MARKGSGESPPGTL
uniref:Uncharacterized protein n=1 Tax=Arundo donax TaxID=35708 RepID=A0A0A9ADI4_ARUDO